MQCSVTAVRRYPVKSMGGEDLAVAELDARGLAGDRWYAVVDDERRLASGKDSRRFRRRDTVFDYAAHTGPGGRVTVSRGDEHWRVGDPLLDRRLSEDMGASVRVTPEADLPHQDMGAVSIVSTASLQWCADRWGGSPDPRRLRVNIVLESDEPFVEDRCTDIELGTARLRVVERIPRCRMIDIVQDGANPGASWLRPLGQERDLCLAVYADVVRPGHVRLGDRVTAWSATAT